MAFFTAISRASSISRATFFFLRYMSNVPENTIYGSCMVVHGYDTTLPITLDEMLIHCRAVALAAKCLLLVGDLPFGSYKSSSTHQGVDTAVRILKEGGMDAIKLKGASPSRITAAKAIVEAGIAVMGHVGLTQQDISVLGGFKPQGKNVSSVIKIVETALAFVKVRSTEPCPRLKKSLAVEKIQWDQSWVKGGFPCHLACFHWPNQYICLSKTLKGRLEAKGEREGERKRREGRGNQREVVSLAACREVLQGRSSELFVFSL
ncbi:hypothetical protein UlMin_036483 [Ulmus minor]